MKISEYKSPTLLDWKAASYTKSNKDGILGVVEGPVQRADVVNGNRRRYGRGVWEKCLNHPSVAERIQERAMVGELDHPSEGTSSYPRVSHLMTEVSLRPDGVVWGKAEILDTPHGRIADALFRGRVRVGISSRGDGSTHEAEDGVTEVEADYIPETWDFVVNPSTPGAFMSPVQESENRKQIALAISSLVESTEDPRVLLESHKIIKEMGEDSSLQEVAQQAAQKLKDCVGWVDCNGQCHTSIKEETVSVQGNSLQGHEGEVVSLAEKLAENRISTFRNQLENDNRRLLRQIQEQAKQLSDSAKREKAAESIIEEFMFRARKLKEERDAATAKVSAPVAGASKVAQLEKELAAAKSLLEAALKAIEKLKGQALKAEAAESVVAALIEHVMTSKRRLHVESLTKGLPNGSQVKKVLEGMSTVQQINETFRLLQGASNGSGLLATREPLPTRGNAHKALVESVGAKIETALKAAPNGLGGQKSGSYLTSRLIEKMGGR